MEIGRDFASLKSCKIPCKLVEAGNEIEVHAKNKQSHHWFYTNIISLDNFDYCRWFAGKSIPLANHTMKMFSWKLYGTDPKSMIKCRYNLWSNEEFIHFRYLQHNHKIKKIYFVRCSFKSSTCKFIAVGNGFELECPIPK